MPTSSAVETVASAVPVAVADGSTATAGPGVGAGVAGGHGGAGGAAGLWGAGGGGGNGGNGAMPTSSAVETVASAVPVAVADGSTATAGPVRAKHHQRADDHAVDKGFGKDDQPQVTDKIFQPPRPGI